VHLVTEHRDDYDTEFAAPTITKPCWSYSRGAITGTTGISPSRMSTDGAAGGVPDEATISAVLTQPAGSRLCWFNQGEFVVHGVIRARFSGRWRRGGR
jgi:hypothetical protein